MCGKKSKKKVYIYINIYIIYICIYIFINGWQGPCMYLCIYSGKNGHTYSKPKSRVLFMILIELPWMSDLAIAGTWVIAFTYPNEMPPVRFPVECHAFLKENRLHLKCSCLNDPLFPVFTSMASYAHRPLTGIMSQILIYPAASIGSLD